MNNKTLRDAISNQCGFNKAIIDKIMDGLPSMAKRCGRCDAILNDSENTVLEIEFYDGGSPFKKTICDKCVNEIQKSLKQGETICYDKTTKN